MAQGYKRIISKVTGFKPNTCKEPVALVQSVGVATRGHVDFEATYKVKSTTDEEPRGERS